MNWMLMKQKYALMLRNKLIIKHFNLKDSFKPSKKLLNTLNNLMKIIKNC